MTTIALIGLIAALGLVIFWPSAKQSGIDIET